MACPICNKEIDPQFRPFCSNRCKDIDLHRWLHGQYAIDDTGSIAFNSDEHLEDAPSNKEYRFDD